MSPLSGLSRMTCWLLVLSRVFGSFQNRPCLLQNGWLRASIVADSVVFYLAFCKSIDFCILKQAGEIWNEPNNNISVSTTLFHPSRKGAQCSKYRNCPLTKQVIVAAVAKIGSWKEQNSQINLPEKVSRSSRTVVERSGYVIDRKGHFRCSAKLNGSAFVLHAEIFLSHFTLGLGEFAQRNSIYKSIIWCVLFNPFYLLYKRAPYLLWCQMSPHLWSPATGRLSCHKEWLHWCYTHTCGRCWNETVVFPVNVGIREYILHDCQHSNLCHFITMWKMTLIKRKPWQHQMFFQSPQNTRCPFHCV